LFAGYSSGLFLDAILTQNDTLSHFVAHDMKRGEMWQEVVVDAAALWNGRGWG
jgi:hypothetical protein